MRTTSVLKRVVILATLFAPGAFAQQPATRQSAATQPAVTDARLDEALSTAAAAEATEAQFIEPLRAVAVRFREIPVTTEPGKAAWHKLTLNERGKKLDAIRFRVPDGEPRDMAWAFIPPENLAGWYVLPVTGEMEGFKQFWRPSARSVLGDKAPAGAKQVMLQTLPSSSLKPGGEYILWFRFRDERPAPLYVAIALPPAAARSLNESGVTQALGLTRQGEDLGVVDLDAPATQPGRAVD